MVSRTSRKKNKGKERKAKKMEAERTRKRNEWILWATGVGKNGKFIRSIGCEHGCGEIPADIDLVSFLGEFYGGENFSPDNLVNASHTTHGETVLKNSMYREMLRNIMIRIGTNMLLLTEGEDDRILRLQYRDSALTLAKSIYVLEHYFDDTSDVMAAINNRLVLSKLLDLNSGSMRDALKFYSKRISCSCLKKMHQEARKTLPKMGRCCGCDEEFERVALSVCSRCMVDQYCSRECQVASWPKHKSIQIVMCMSMLTCNRSERG